MVYLKLVGGNPMHHKIFQSAIRVRRFAARPDSKKARLERDQGWGVRKIPAKAL
jgi:hypothetical protein